MIYKKTKVVMKKIELFLGTVTKKQKNDVLVNDGSNKMFNFILNKNKRTLIVGQSFAGKLFSCWINCKKMKNIENPL